MEIILRKFGCGWQSFFINETIYIFNPKKKVAIKQSLNFEKFLEINTAG